MGIEILHILGWVLVVALFAVGMAGTVYPVLPSVLAIYPAFFIYGWFFGFDRLHLWFWIIETFIVAVVFIADHLVSALGVKKYGGSRASIIGSTIGIIAGPFVIPVVGLVAGPFIGAVAGELLIGRTFQDALKAGFGAVVGLFSSMVVKIILQLVMIALFLIAVFG